MKDYISELENKKKKQKIWAIVFVIAFILVSTAILLFYDDFREEVNNKVEEVTNENLELIKDTIEKNRAVDTLSLDVELLAQNEHKLIQNDSAKDSTINLLIDSIKNLNALVEELSKASKKVNPNSQAEVINKLSTKNRRILKNINSGQNNVPVVDNNKYNIQFIYMAGAARKHQQALKRITNRDLSKRYQVVKNEQLDKFAYNPSIRYFHEEDGEVAKKLLWLMEAELDLKFDLRKLNLPSPKKTIEIWIGKKDKR